MSDLTHGEELFRMANPVPDPANPPTWASTVAATRLILDERRGTMQTEQTTPQELKPPAGRRNRLAVAAVAFAVVVTGGIALIVSATQGGGSNNPAAVPIEPARAVPDDPTLTLSGTECTYEGPSEFVLGEERFVRVFNNTDGRLEVKTWRTQDGKTAEAIGPLALLGAPGQQESAFRLGDEVPPGGDAIIKLFPSPPIPDEAGTWILACFTPFGVEGDVQDLATIYEVSPG